MSRFQKGQSIVEFAIVLPFFFLLLFGVIYFGMLFSDYISLNNAARSSAREAEIAASAASDINDVRTRYQGVCRNTKQAVVKRYLSLRVCIHSIQRKI